MRIAARCAPMHHGTLKRALVAAAIAIGAAAVALAAFDWNSARGVVERRLGARFGRDVTIAGDLDVRLGWPVRIVAHDVSVSNPDWARRAELVTAQRITLVVSPLALARRPVDFREIELVEPRLSLERRDGQRTWAFGREGRGRAPVVGRLRIADGTVEFLDPAARTALTARVTAAGPATDDVAVSARGTYRGEPLRLAATGATVLGLADHSRSYPLTATLQLGKTHARLNGTVTGLPRPSAMDVELELAGDDLAGLKKVFPFAAPSTPPYALRGHLRYADHGWSIDAVHGRIGESDVAGKLVYSHGARPHLALEITSERLDFDDLGPLIGAPPRTRGETASAEQREQARRMRAAGQALPDKPLDFGSWQRLDVDASIVGKRVLHPPMLPIQSLDAKLRIADGVLHVAPLRLGIAGGVVVATVEVDGRAEPARGAAEVEVRGLALRQLFPTVAAMKTARGVAHGRARLAGTGTSVAGLLGSAEGRISLAIDRGSVSNVALELLGLDVGETLLLFATGDREVALRCAVADFGVRHGVAKSNVLVVDTDDTLVVGSGIVDLAGERLDLALYPRPKDASILAARSPLRVRGSLRNPQVTPDTTALATRGAAAALLALVNPLLALAPFIETGPGEDSDCARLLANAKRWSAAAPAAVNPARGKRG